MNLDRVQVFVRIVESGTRSAAARVMHLTQPALSRNLRLLEEDLGAPLFDRVGRGLVLTAAGRALLPRARALLAQARDLTREIEEVAGRRYFDVLIGTVDSVATWLFPAIVEPLRDSFEDLAVKLQTARTAELLRRLSAGELDLVLCAWSGPPPVARATRVGPYDLRFWGRRDRFGALEDALTEDEVRRFPLIEIESMPGQPTMIPTDAASWAVSGSLASVKALVLAGFGVGALLSFMLTPAERCELVRSPVGHDPDCALWVCAGPFWRGAVETAIESTLSSALEGALSAALGTE